MSKLVVMVKRHRAGGDIEKDAPAGTRIDHEQAKQMISRAWDGELSPAEESVLFEHLHGCPDCTAAAERMRTLIAALDAALKPRRE